LINRPFENEEYGRGQYTSKIYHLQRWHFKIQLPSKEDNRAVF
jgi:hypothetical protein